jgi:hypothetical protein
MAEGGRGPALADDPLVIRVSGRGGMGPLHGHVSVQTSVTRSPHGSHSPRGDHLKELISIVD